MGSSDRSESGSLAGFFVGALVGAGIALLFAPQAGAQLRGFLRDSAARAKDELDEVVDHGTEVLDSAVAQGHEFVEKGKESLRRDWPPSTGICRGGKEGVQGHKGRTGVATPLASACTVGGLLCIT